VSLESYVTQVRKQSVRKMIVRKADVERAFGDLVIDPKVLGQIGTGLNSGASIFVHGPAGVGKTAIAETMSRVLAEDSVWIPYSIEVDGQMIVVYDPMIHKRVDGPQFDNCDERWIRCQRPAVLVGGELTIDMLDLQFNATTKFYSGPVQMKANNGVLIMDDFGRQRVRPEDLLNRWVVPLDRGIDFLTMAGGRKIEIPFEMLVVFSTNLDPADLVDAAFLRRMQTKIRVDMATDDQFRQIFRRSRGAPRPQRRRRRAERPHPRHPRRSPSGATCLPAARPRQSGVLGGPVRRSPADPGPRFPVRCHGGLFPHAEGVRNEARTAPHLSAERLALNPIHQLRITTGMRALRVRASPIAMTLRFTIKGSRCGRTDTPSRLL